MFICKYDSTSCQLNLTYSVQVWVYLVLLQWSKRTAALRVTVHTCVFSSCTYWPLIVKVEGCWLQKNLLAQVLDLIFRYLQIIFGIAWHELILQKDCVIHQEPEMALLSNRPYSVETNQRVSPCVVNIIVESNPLMAEWWWSKILKG